ncbi:GapA-binding peptide SR1P [Anaerobacillus sp. CMMVII]|nr:GapA-binding peptide SR1P [Anaerobacillus sp. CMMVII]MCT8139085.1 GapA-binding peptide SR1P [Anaerobacillus sp. CMMVII]
MGVIVCQTCGKVIEHFEAEKVSTLYGTCCNDCNKNQQCKK